MPIPILADKRVRFDPFITYIGEEVPNPEAMREESMVMDGSTFLGSIRRASVTGGGKRRSMDMQDMYGMERPLMTDNSSGGFGSFGCSFGSFGASGDLNMGIDSMFREEDEEELSEEDTSEHDSAKERRKKFATSEFMASDSSFPDLRPLQIMDDRSMIDTSTQQRPKEAKAMAGISVTNDVMAS